MKHKTKLLVPVGSDISEIALHKAQGKPLESIQVYHDHESLNLDLQFHGGLSLELSFQTAFQASARLLRWKGGNSEIVRRIRPRFKRSTTGKTQG